MKLGSDTKGCFIITHNTRKHLESQGPLTKKNSITNKELIEESAQHSHEYHDPIEEVTWGKVKGDGELRSLASIIAKFDNMD